MVNSTLSNLNIYSSAEQQHSSHYLPQCILKWLQGLLLVSPGQQTTQPYISAFETKQQLVECLKQSPVRLVGLHPNLREAKLKLWADACEQANKPVFLRGTIQKKFQKQGQISIQPKQWMDSIVAFLLLLLLSPIILATAILIYLYSPEPIVPRQWYMGTRGKFFRLHQFPTTVANEDSRATLLPPWMCKYNVDKLPQLFHVLRGEISLRDSLCPLTLSEALRLGSEGQQYVSILLEIPEAQIQGNNSNKVNLVVDKHSIFNFKSFCALGQV
jgi:hypothetical protein